MGDGMTDIDQVLKHAQLAHFDNEVTSMVILMVVKGEPEVHLAIVSTDVFVMNGAVDMFKTEMQIMMKAATQEMKDRE